ncbi:MAG: hypothetical protein RLZZ217_1635, partial [Planctomycetota bacterium]
VELMAPGGAAEANLPALRPVEPARVRGFNYSKGRIVEVQLYEVVTGD